MSDPLQQAREAFAARRWRDAVENLLAAVDTGPVPAEDLERLATAANLVGDESVSIDAWARAYRARVDAGEVGPAVRCAFQVGMQLMTAGDHAQGGGWLARGHGLLDELPEDAPERGLMRLPIGLQQLFAGNAEEALEHFTAVVASSDQTRDPSMAALARLGQGQALVALGAVAEGMAYLDEAMIAVTSGEVGPIETGVIYCAVILACHDVYDLDRAREWTAALSRWCEAQPDLVPFRGQCMVHRSQVLQYGGDWPAATTEAARAVEHLSQPPPKPALGAARYQQAEMHRLAGDDDLAESAYRDAVAHGHAPHPGLALLRLRQGRVEDAWAAIRRELDERPTAAVRCVVLPAFVDIAIAADQREAARDAADELRTIADESAMLRALSDYAAGAVDLADGDPKGALPLLRRAATAWQELDVPYEVARTRVLIGSACAAVGDRDTAAIEWDAARRTFDDLGALPDLDAMDVLLTGPSAPQDRSGLTGREVEVLALVATGMTNREVAEALVISEKTVARHLSNIFTKIDVSSRAAATAYAIKHGLA